MSLSLNASRKHVALVLDHPQRDLPGVVLVALELCRRGVTCSLVPLNIVERELWSLAPDFVLLNYTRRGKEAVAGRLREAGIRTGLLDTEGLVADAEIGEDGELEPRFGNYTDLLWTDPTLRSEIDPACIWGSRLAEHLIAGGFFTAQQTVVTGCPRFDFYHPSWRSVFDDARSDENARPNRVLLNTWYPLYNSRLVSAEVNAKQLREVLGWPEERIRKYYDDERVAIHAMIELAGRLAADFPKTEILLRPHPFENDEVYRAGLSKRPLANLRVNRDGPVHPQIFGSSVLIARSCTTAIEAGMANVPSLSPRWVPAPSLSPIAESISIACEDYAALREKVEEILAGRYGQASEEAEKSARVLKAWCHHIDGLAHRRVSDAVMARLPETRRVDEALCARFLNQHEQNQKRGRSWRTRVKTLIGLPSDFSVRRMKLVTNPYREAKAFDLPEVETLISKINRALEAQGREPVSVTIRRSGESGPRGLFESLRSIVLEQGVPRGRVEAPASTLASAGRTP